MSWNRGKFDAWGSNKLFSQSINSWRREREGARRRLPQFSSREQRMVAGSQSEIWPQWGWPITGQPPHHSESREAPYIWMSAPSAVTRPPSSPSPDWSLVISASSWGHEPRPSLPRSRACLTRRPGRGPPAHPAMWRRPQGRTWPPPTSGSPPLFCQYSRTSRGCPTTWSRVLNAIRKGSVCFLT